MIKTMLDMYTESGWLPKWELAGNETYMMVGDPATIVIADSYIKGIDDIDAEIALKAMLKPADLKPGEKAPPIRAGYHEQLEYGYIPADQDTTEEWWVWGPVSTQLEYCLADWSISRIAAKLNRDELSDMFLKRSLSYKNIYDSYSGFLRPRMKDGSWLMPFDPLATEGSGYWQGSGGPGYVEGNAWNYTWFVPHDIRGLIDLFGREDRFAGKLKECFTQDRFTINNEPDIAYPYLFTYIKGKENLTSQLVSRIVQTEFGTGADGLPGNDDCGTISGWLVFSMLGFYPTCPGSESYQLGIPSFERAVIHLSTDYYPAEKFMIKRKIMEDGNKNISRILFDDKIVNDYKLKHTNIVNGGLLIFESD
jgi:predicted alpha-1,2-mannosidase